MTQQLAVSTLVKGLEEQARTNGTAVVRTLVQSENFDDVLKAVLEPDDFINAMTALRPRILYLAERKFDAEEGVRSELEIGDGSEGEDEEPRVRSESASTKAFRDLVKKWEVHNADMYEYVASFLGDGILHLTSTTESWAERFQDEVKALVEKIGGEEQVRQSEKDNESVRLIEEMAKTLSKHPQFNAPKATKAKRAYLTRKLFPEIDDKTVATVLEEAENMDWYPSNRG